MTANNVMSLKEAAREAKKRFKSGFWIEYRATVEEKLENAAGNDVSSVKIKNYYLSKAKCKISGRTNEEAEFYKKVKAILEAGEDYNAIGILTDKNVYDSLDYSGKQRYILNLSERYRLCVEKIKNDSLLDEDMREIEGNKEKTSIA